MERPIVKPVVALFALVLASAGLTSHAAPPAQAPDLRGEVLETRSVESYTYLRLKTDQGEIWAAVPTTAVNKGAHVTIGNPMTMLNFESKTLKKVFDKIVFGQIVGADGKLVAPPVAPTPSAAVVPVVKVAKAAGPDAKTVAEVVKGKAGLNERTVLVRGRVVKANLQIMGRNWFHLQDGSGSASDGTNDILVTSKDEAAVGDIVNARGAVHTNVDFGSGYSYPVLIENANLRK